MQTKLTKTDQIKIKEFIRHISEMCVNRSFKGIDTFFNYSPHVGSITVFWYKKNRDTLANQMHESWYIYDSEEVYDLDEVLNKIEEFIK